MGCGGSRSAQTTPSQKKLNSADTGEQSSDRQRGVTSKLFVKQSQGHITSVYKFGKVLGDGAFGKVSVGTHRHSGVKRALKTITRSKRDSSQEKNFLNEVELLAAMDHPNIIKIYEYFIDNRHFHLATELIAGGELFDYILDQKHLSEQMAMIIMKQLMSAINYCHQKNVVHRDLKPENMLLEQKPGPLGEHLNIKVIDFGTSQLFQSGEKLSTMYGTPYYIAPEVLKGSYDAKCDVWSAGVIMYILLCGCPPFNAKKDDEIYAKIKSMKYNFDNKAWQNVSDLAKDLIGKMLVGQSARLDAAGVLAHPWFTAQQQPQVKISLAALDNLKTFRAERELQKAVLVFITSQCLSDDDVKELKETFVKFDSNGDGKIDKGELIQGYSEIVGPEEAIVQANEVFATVDIDGSGYIDYSEFITAAMNKKKLLSKKNLNEAFRIFDTDGSGSITVDEIKTVLGGLGQEKDDTVWAKIIAEVDADGNGEIDIKEFKEMMNKLF